MNSEITDLATPKTVSRFQRFISFINFYHQLIKDFTKLLPIPGITEGDV